MARFAPKPHVRKGDQVLVLRGKDRGKQGAINSMVIDEDKVRAVVAGVNIVKRHLKNRPDVRQTGIVEREAPLHISNLMLICPQCGKPTRIGRSQLPDGRRVRVCKKCDQVIDSRR